MSWRPTTGRRGTRRAPSPWRCPWRTAAAARSTGSPRTSSCTDEYNAYSSGANQDLAINALSELIGESEALAIRSRSLSYNYLTINEATASLLQVLMIGVFPLAVPGRSGSISC